MIETFTTLSKTVNSLMSFMTSYSMLTVLIVIAALLLLAAGTFVTFKNGIFSKISYVAAIAVLVFASIGAYTNIQPLDDLDLGDPETIKVAEVTTDGLVVRNQRWSALKKVYPLTGIDLLQEQDGKHFETMKQSVMDLINDKEVVVAKSNKYDGYVISTASHVELNSYLLSNGLARTKAKCPSSYVALENTAKQNRLGVFAVSNGVLLVVIWKYIIYAVISALCTAINTWIQRRLLNGDKTDNNK